jgi:hypothetical protein
LVLLAIFGLFLGHFSMTSSGHRYRPPWAFRHGVP